MNQDDDTAPPIVAATEGADMTQILGQGTEDGIPLLDLPPSNESNQTMQELSTGSSNSTPTMPPENSTQRGTASEVRINADPQELFGVTRTTETRNVLLLVIGIFASACLTATCNMPAKFLKENYLDATDVISDGLPNIVYLLVFSSSLFMTCMAVIVILGWRLRFRSVLLFLVISASLVYIIIVNEITPGFRVRIGKSNISSIAFMWLSVVVFIFFGISTLSIGKYPLYSIWRFLHWLWGKINHLREEHSSRLDRIVGSRAIRKGKNGKKKTLRVFFTWPRGFT